MTHWGSALVAVVEQKGERERFWQGLASGYPSSLRFNQIQHGSISGKIFLLGLKRTTRQVSLVGLFEKREEKRKRLED
jgi:hypothetical protein